MEAATSTAATPEGLGSAAEAAAPATGLHQEPKLQGSTTCLITRVKLPVGTRLRHEDKGLCTLTEVAGNGSWVVKFEASGETHTLKPNAQHKLKVEGGQVKPADVVVAVDESSQESSKPSRRAPNQARTKAAVFEVDLDATVRQVFAEHRAAILGNDALGRHAQLFVMQDGCDVLGDRWCSLQYSYDARRKHALVRLVAEGGEGADHATLTFRTHCADRICPALLHGGAGAVGNYRAEHEPDLRWLLEGPSSRPLAFREFFVQSSHNTFILGQQLKLALRGNPVDIVYVEAFPIALNLGYRCLELDVFYRAHEKAGGELLVRHGPIGAPSNSVALSAVLAAIADWMARDERCATARLRLPLVLSVENNLHSEAAELEMAASFEHVFGARLVPPASFHDPPMRDLAREARRVILKGGSYLKGGLSRELGSSRWAELVAMWKPPIHPLDPEATVCKSVEAPMGSALANPSRLIAQSSHFLSTAAKRSTRASLQLGHSLTRSLTVSLTGLLDHQPPTAADAPPSRKPPHPERSAATNKTPPSRTPPSRSDGSPSFSRSGGSSHSARTALWVLPTAAAGATSGATEVPAGGAAESDAVLNAARELKATVAIQARFRGRVAREDRRLEALYSDEISSGRCDAALALELQLRVINARRKANERRAEARHAADPALRVDRLLCKVYPPKAYQLSQNFDPVGGFDARAHFISMNMQGHATSGRARLTAEVRRGAAAPPSTKCVRERARSVERLFLRDGYDGYLRMDAWGVRLRHDLEHLLAAEAVAEAHNPNPHPNLSPT